MFTNWCLVKGRAVQDANREPATTIHELGHVFGAIDHYYDGTKASEGKHSTTTLDQLDQNDVPYNSYCIYGEERSSVNDLTMCAGCKHFIKEHAGMFN